MSSLLSSNSAAAAAIGRVRCLADEEADHNMLQDLHLAAELGKTLLERNKELEATIKTYQTTIEDQALEIEYLKKQVTAMKEVNNSRLKVYENLEQVINDLEHKNQQLENEKAKDKNKIVSLRKIVDEVQNRYHDLEDKHEALKRVQQTLEPPASPRNRAMLDSSIQNGAVSPTSLLSEKSDSSIKDCISLPNDDEMKRQLQESRQQRANVQKKLNELMEQMSLLVQEKSDMEEQMEEKAQQVSSLERDVKHLEELWKGQLCRLCGSTMERDTDAPSMLLEEDEELDTRSLAESLADSYQDSGFMMQEFGNKIEPLEEDSSCQDSYRVLVEKYEALVKVHQNAPRRKQAGPGPSNGYSTGSGCLSLQEELQMSGEFGSNLTTSLEESSLPSTGQVSDAGNVNGTGVPGPKIVAPVGEGRPTGNKPKPFAGTPTDFSEAETSSSGFADETSNKATQTEGRPGSFLCSIADGDDCRFSIYDDTSTFESRFHQTPEYRKLFSEIFQVLKRAAEAKDVVQSAEAVQAAAAAASAAAAESTGATLTGDSEALTPLAEQCPGFGFFEDGASEATDDTNSVVSLAVSSVASEPVFRVHTPLFARKDDSSRQHPHRQPAKQSVIEQQQAEQSSRRQSNSSEPMRPLHNNTRRQPLEYLSVQVRKRPAGKNKARRPADSPALDNVLQPTANPRVSQLRGGGSRRKFRPLTASELNDGLMWNGSTAHFYPSKSARSARHHHNQQQQREGGASGQQQRQPDGQFRPDGLDYKPGSALEEVAKLRRLEMSYAEVLRMPNKTKSGAPRQRRNH